MSKKEADKLVEAVEAWDAPTDSGQINDFGETRPLNNLDRSGGTHWCMNSCMRDEAVLKVNPCNPCDESLLSVCS